MSRNIPSRTSEKGQGTKGFAPIETYAELREGFGRVSSLDESERSSAEWEIFKNWSDKKGICYLSFSDKEPDTGGHEHNVLVEGAFYLKQTKWDCAGLIYDPDAQKLIPATVSEYILRLCYQDILFGSETELLGITTKGNSRAILTRQKIIEGAIPEEGKLHDYFTALGGEYISQGDGLGYCGSVYQYNALYVADVRADNWRVLKGSDGSDFFSSFDVIIADSTNGNLLDSLIQYS